MDLLTQGGYVTPSVECFEIVAEQCFAESVNSPYDSITDGNYEWQDELELF